MGSRESRRRLQALLGALYDLGEETAAREDGEASSGAAPRESRTPRDSRAAQEIRAPQPAAGDVGGAAGGRRRARDFFGELRAELDAAATASPPPPAASPAVEVVVFRGRKRRPGSAAPTDGAQTKIVEEEKNVKEQEFNFEKARLEVHKFGITGYNKQEQRLWEQERAIMLGAKPPKKKHVNYKTYQEKMKEKKSAKDDDKGKEHKGDSLKKKKKKKDQERKVKKKKSVSNIWPAGQVGKFRDGTLILQSRDIKKIKSSKVIK